MKFFNTAGPIKPEAHYYVSQRFDLAELDSLIAMQKYFVLHAPRQTGKTSLIMEYAKTLNAAGKYTALYVNVEPAQAARNDYVAGLSIILQRFVNAIKLTFYDKLELLELVEKYAGKRLETGNEFSAFLQEWTSINPKPVVLFIDEIDSLVGDTLISVLRQLRAGYANRPEGFPQAVCLIGVRDVRDYRIWSEANQNMILGGSAFNIKAKSLRLDDFTYNNVADLLEQHTKETGQVFERGAIDYIFEQTQGQPQGCLTLKNKV